MREDNVLIKIRERGKLIGTRSGHNTWVENGRKYLSELITYSSFSPLTTVRSDRLRYMGVGIGSAGQNNPSVADSPPFSTAYPAGFDPNATNGHSYDRLLPVSPPVSTLERPVRVTGGSTPYPGVPADVWLIEHPNFYLTHPNPMYVAAHGKLNGPGGDVAYGSFTSVPLSEVGLFTDAVTTSKNKPYSPLVAYYSFDTIMMSSVTEVEFIWTVRF